MIRQEFERVTHFCLLAFAYLQFAIKLDFGQKYFTTKLAIGFKYSKIRSNQKQSEYYILFKTYCYCSFLLLCNNNNEYVVNVNKKRREYNIKVKSIWCIRLFSVI